MKLYNPVQHQLSAYCRVVAGNEEKALDLIQETLTSAFESFEKLRDNKSFLFFLFSIARNCHIKQQRRWKFFGKQSDIKTVDIEVQPDYIERQYDLELIHNSIFRLSAGQREVILMFHLLGFSIKDIAKEQNITEAAVKNRLVRGREKLRKLLSDKESLITNNISAHNSKTFTK